MKYAICLQSVVPVRAEPFDRSEMVSQLLFGELMGVTDTLNGWLQVSTDHDGYSGWIDEKQSTPLEEESFLSIKSSVLYLVTDPMAILENQAGSKIFIVAGSALPGLQNNQLTLAGYDFHFKGIAVERKDHGTRSSVIQYAMRYEGVPYLWGGRTPFGIDCSGFTQMVYRLAGIPLHRDAHQQALQGRSRSFVDEAQPGDLAFFDDEEGRIIHTGIVLDQGKIIHASGSVRIDTLDHQGIFNKDTRNYTHMLRLIRYLI
jgi:hypothetical protein